MRASLSVLWLAVLVQVSPRLIVGCPARRREWVFPAWLAAVDEACNRACVEPYLVFVGDPSDPTFTTLNGRSGWELLETSESSAPDVRRWDDPRYRQMVELRNRLLGRIRELAPTFFLSLDSDVLLHPDAVVSLIDALVSFDAVGGRTYMQERGRAAPSCGVLTRTGAMRRPDGDGLFPVDVIMAVKLMSPAAYMVDYRYHRSGEDIGWATACRERGLRLGWDGRVVSKHVMSREALERHDDRCGW